MVIEAEDSALIGSSSPAGIDFFGSPALLLGQSAELLAAFNDRPIRIVSDSDLDLSFLGFSGSPRHSLVADLTRGEAELHRGVRKSFRSLINWGRNNIELKFVNTENPDRDAFDSFQALHAHVSGRQTRPQGSWDAMFDWIASGGGELSLGYIDGIGLAASTLVVDGTESSFYASGAYLREHFDKPLSHWPVYSSMLRSMQRGMRFYDFGVLPNADANKKETDIAHFKRGFSNAIKTKTDWMRP